METIPTRRAFLATGIASAALPFFADASGKEQDGEEGKAKGKEKEEEEVSPAEDLMREHGVLKRIMLVYGEAITRLDAGKELSPDPVAAAAKMVRSFVEDYHEKLEEDFLFPRFRKAKVEVELVDVLTAQHAAGRKLTDVILRSASVKSLKEKEGKAALRQAMSQFIRMYSPHEAREDTVLFPALRRIVSAHEYAALGEDFEKKEHALFGEDGFEKMVSRVADIEKSLDIYELAQFTP